MSPAKQDVLYGSLGLIVLETLEAIERKAFGFVQMSRPLVEVPYVKPETPSLPPVERKILHQCDCSSANALSFLSDHETFQLQHAVASLQAIDEKEPDRALVVVQQDRVKRVVTSQQSFVLIARPWRDEPSIGFVVFEKVDEVQVVNACRS